MRKDKTTPPMKNNKQHNAPWFKEINNKGAIIDNYGNLIARADKEEISEFIVTACNSYHSLKQQNEELMKIIKEIHQLLDDNKNEYDERFIELKVSDFFPRTTDLLTKYNQK